MPTKPRLQLDKTGRFLSVPDPRASEPSSDGISLEQHLTWLRRICGN